MESNDITLTLPAITSADNGLSISINNVGTFEDLITVVGNGSATIDGEDNTYLPRWVGFNYMNISVNGANRVITVGIVKNGVTTTRLGETTLRTVTANQPYQYSTTIYVQNVVKDDYFELFVSSATNGDVVNFQDVNIYVTSQ